MLAFMNVYDTFCVVKTMSCGLRFVPAAAVTFFWDTVWHRVKSREFAFTRKKALPVGVH